MSVCVRERESERARERERVTGGVWRVECGGWSGACMTGRCAGDVGLDLQQRASGPRRAHLLGAHAQRGQHQAALLPQGPLARRLVATPRLSRSSSSLSISAGVSMARYSTPPPSLPLRRLHATPPTPPPLYLMPPLDTSIADRLDVIGSAHLYLRLRPYLPPAPIFSCCPISSCCPRPISR